MNRFNTTIICLIVFTSCGLKKNDDSKYSQQLAERVYENYLISQDCDELLSFEDSINFSYVLESEHFEMFSYCSAIHGHFEKAEKYRQFALAHSKSAHDSIRYIIAEVEILEYAKNFEKAIQVGKEILHDNRLGIMDESFLLHKISELFQSTGELDSAEYYIRLSLVERFNVSSNRLFSHNQYKLCEILKSKGKSCEQE